ncbi:MAG: DUF2336 domain-containing protein, partial [Pseudolabrys sp.]
DQQILLSAARNPGARFSSKGFGVLVERASGDDQLGACVGARPDLPPQLFDALLAAASATVRAKLEAERQYAREDIARVVGGVSERIAARACVNKSSAYAAAQVLVEQLKQARRLTAAKLDAFAKADRFDEVVAALVAMGDAPLALVESTVGTGNAETIVVLARAIDLPWETTKNIIGMAAKRHQRPTGDIEKSLAAFRRLKQSTAQQILDFHRKHARAAPVRIQ